jgi:hypothetical protein
MVQTLSWGINRPRSAGYRRGTAPEDIVGGPLQVDGLDLPSLHRSTTGLAKGRATNRDHNLVVDCRRGGPGQRTPPWVTRPEDAATGDPRRHDNAGEAEMGRRRHCWWRGDGSRTLLLWGSTVRVGWPCHHAMARMLGSGPPSKGHTEGDSRSVPPVEGKGHCA